MKSFTGAEALFLRAVIPQGKVAAALLATGVDDVEDIAADLPKADMPLQTRLFVDNDGWPILLFEATRGVTLTRFLAGKVLDAQHGIHDGGLPRQAIEIQVKRVAVGKTELKVGSRRHLHCSKGSTKFQHALKRRWDGTKMATARNGLEQVGQEKSLAPAIPKESATE